MSYNIRTKYTGEGVYAILCLKKMRCYVGSSHNVYKRGKNHLSCLKRGKHHIKELQADFDKGYKMEFIVLEKTHFGYYNNRDLLFKETCYMYKMLCDDFILYNSQGVKGETRIEKQNYLSNSICHWFCLNNCVDVHEMLKKEYGLTGYKISYAHNRI